MLPDGPDRRSQVGPAKGGRGHHVQHPAVSAQLRKQDRPSHFPDARLMEFLKKLLRPPAASPRDVIQFFNQAAADEEHYPSTIDPRIYHVQLILDHFGDLTGQIVL